MRLSLSVALGLALIAPISIVHAVDKLNKQNVSISTQQRTALGIETTLITVSQTNSTMTAQLHPAKVVVPSKQLRVVAAPMAGLITQVLVLENDVINNGQTMAQLASPLLAEAQRDLIQSAVAANLATDSLKRDELLLKEGIIPEARYRATQASALQAQAMLSEKRQSLRLAGLSDTALRELETGRMRNNEIALRSPIAGIVIEQAVTAGQRVDSSSPLYKVAQLDPIWVEAQIPPELATAIKTGQTAQLDKYNIVGKIISIANSINESQTALVRVAFANPQKILKPGQAVQISLPHDNSQTGQVQIHKSTLIRIANEPMVFIDQGNHFVPTKVEIMGETELSYWVKGLKIGDRVVRKGVSSLKAMLTGIGSDGAGAD
ncbi:efflux RND transporter periplasmic adaptor subunit [Ampullimonas aquatilis]|uniref:efflux RND transporter periplasmic adaptor subunit n=1 Tax=Ampullimonas aquatilis TaxID=1341549 RepID=UPI003C75C43D